MTSTIVALSTPIGRSAIAVVRMSGSNAIKIAKEIFSPFPQKPNFLQVGKLSTQNFADQAMCVFFRAPHSYTGEDSVEFHCHGGVMVFQAVIDRCLALGATMAKNGEFSKRAFINGKMNLSNTEGVIEMIDAETYSAVKAGENLLNDSLGKLTVDLQSQLTDIFAQTEVTLDYPEEDLELPTKQQLTSQIASVLQQIERLISTAKTGKLIKYGINVAIVGKTNVGKSSLLNSLLGSDRAIVSGIAGTTRDTLTESLFYKDTKFNFVDTAGLRTTRNEIEREGIKRAKAAVLDADVVLYLVDNPEDVTQFACACPVIKVFNKADVYGFGQNTDGIIFVSAKCGENIEQLKETIYNLFRFGDINYENVILTNARHVDCLNKTASALKDALAEISSNTLDCVSVNLKSAWNNLGEITGTCSNEEIIDRIYSKFCLGK